MRFRCVRVLFISLSLMTTASLDAVAQTAATPEAMGTPKSLTDVHCKIFKEHLIEYIKIKGRDYFDADFLDAMQDYGFKRGCTAPALIPSNEREGAVFLAIVQLMKDNQGIDIQNFGINLYIRAQGKKRLTAEQCKIFKGNLIEHIKVVGREHVSDDFVKAMGDFAFKAGCSTPVSIPVVGGNLKDIDVFNSISSLMRATQGVELRLMGIVPYARTSPAPK